MGGQRQLIAPAAEATIAYDPETGDELWRTLHPGGFNVAARPIHAHGMVYVFTSGLTASLMAIHLYCLTRGFERSDEQVAADVYPGRKEPQEAALAADEDIDWEEAYTQLLKKDPGVREKVESGGATKEQVIVWMKKQARSKDKRGGK